MPPCPKTPTYNQTMRPAIATKPQYSASTNHIIHSAVPACHSLPTIMSFFLLHYTGKSAFLLPAPSFSNPTAIHGPTTGILPTNPAIVAKKSPNSTNIPYSSIRKPKKGQRRRISRMPAAKASVPFHFWRRAKKALVFCTPIMSVRPMRKRICLSASVRERRCKKGGFDVDVRCPLLAWDGGLVGGRGWERGVTLRTWRGQKTSLRRRVGRTRLRSSCQLVLSFRAGIGCARAAYLPPEQKATPISKVTDQYAIPSFQNSASSRSTYFGCL